MQLTYHPVGRGLFCSGKYGDFRWVYDCGSLTTYRYLESEIKPFWGLDSIDLFVVSHLDLDHINGAMKFLEVVPVKVLALPYVPLVERLYWAFQQPSRNFPLHVVADPAAYISESIGESRTQIKYLATAEQLKSGAVQSTTLPSSNTPSVEYFPEGRRPEDHDAPLSNAQLRSRIDILNHKRVFPASSAWEFLFYNEANFDMELASLSDNVLEVVKESANEDGTLRSKELFEKLRKIYCNYTGTSSRQRNQISLAMYSGSIGHLNGAKLQVHEQVDDHMGSPLLRPYRPRRIRASTKTLVSEVRANFAALYTGDLHMDTEARIHALKDHFGPERWNKIFALQVPHHGSSLSWYEGASALMPHSVSIFAADGFRLTYQPSPVVSDLRDKMPILVDKNEHVSICWDALPS